MATALALGVASAAFAGQARGGGTGGSGGGGQGPRGTVLSAPTKRMTGTRVAESPVIDGLMDDAVWQRATPITEFTQAEPFEGTPATEKTEVRLLYDDRAIYVGIICFDSDPSQIVTTDARRDSSLNDSDSVQIIFDTYHDRQNGFIFGTNPAGMEYDAQVRSEGETQSSGPPTLGRVGGGAGGGVNVNWDGAWTVRSQITDKGWSTEFQIPLRTLRYGPAPQTWGINFSRNIRRKREQVYWSPISRAFNITRLSAAGEVTNLELKTPMNLKVMPYGINTLNRNFTPGSKLDTNRDFGVDAKVGVTSSLNLDLTYNTDFAQVEVDEQQINLTRFNLLFPEKRPFFLENRGLFAVGRSGEVDLFFSRAIGISPNGDFIPIQGGARLTGRTHGLNVGIIDMQTEAVGNPAQSSRFTPANNFFAGRLQKEISSRSNVGAMFVNRQGTGTGPGSDGWNRTWAADARWGVNQNLTINGFVARTETPGATGAEHAFNGGIEYRDRANRAYFDYTEVGADFNPEVGFLERPDAYRQIGTGYFKNFRRPWLLKTLKMREFRPHQTFEGYWGFDGYHETSMLHLDHALDFESGYFISPGVNVQHEGLRVPFVVHAPRRIVVPAGDYTTPYFFWQSNTDRKRLVSGGLAWNYGGFLSGHQNAQAPTLTVRTPSGGFTSTLRWTRNDITLPQGNFVTNVGSLRTTYNFSPRVNVQGLVQYNDLTDRWSTNIRFNWQQTAATGLYVVYNDTEAFNGIGPVNRAFIIKYVHMWDVFQ
jgi:hypothetical protein